MRFKGVMLLLTRMRCHNCQFAWDESFPSKYLFSHGGNASALAAKMRSILPMSPMLNINGSWLTTSSQTSRTTVPNISLHLISFASASPSPVDMDREGTGLTTASRCMLQSIKSPRMDAKFRTCAAQDLEWCSVSRLSKMRRTSSSIWMLSVKMHKKDKLMMTLWTTALRIVYFILMFYFVILFCYFILLFYFVILLLGLSWCPAVAVE